MFGFFKKGKAQVPPALPESRAEEAQEFLQGVQSFATGELNDLEGVIFQAKSGIEVSQEVLINKILNSSGYIISVSAEELNQCAKLRDPETGEKRLVVFSSSRLASEAIEERPGPYKHIEEMPFPQIFQACDQEVGVAVNPFSDQLIFELSASSVREINQLIDPA